MPYAVLRAHASQSQWAQGMRFGPLGEFGARGASNRLHASCKSRGAQCVVLCYACWRLPVGCAMLRNA
eukprot:8221045-Pyramimonas_sp.AAC.1